MSERPVGWDEWVKLRSDAVGSARSCGRAEMMPKPLDDDETLRRLEREYNAVEAADAFVLALMQRCERAEAALATCSISPESEQGASRNVSGADSDGSTSMADAEALICLMEVVAQFAIETPNGAVHDGGLSAVEGAITLLCERGVMKRDEHRPDMDWYRFDLPATERMAAALRTVQTQS